MAGSVQRNMQWLRLIRHESRDIVFSCVCQNLETHYNLGRNAELYLIGEYTRFRAERREEVEEVAESVASGRTSSLRSSLDQLDPR